MGEESALNMQFRGLIRDNSFVDGSYFFPFLTSLSRCYGLLQRMSQYTGSQEVVIKHSSHRFVN